MATGKKKKGGRILILLALVLILGLVAVFVLFRNVILNNLNVTPLEEPPAGADQGAPAQAITNIVDIYVLQQPVARGQVIEEGHLLKVAYPRERMIEGLFIVNPADAIGKRAMFELQAGLPLTFSMISPSAEGSYASFQIPRGYVAVTIPLTDDMGISSVAFTIRPGDHVNVIGSMLFVDLDSQWQTRLPNVIAPVYSPAINVNLGEEEQEQNVTAPSTLIPVSAQVMPNSGLPYVGRSEVLTGISGPTGEIFLSAYILPAEEQRPRLVSQTIIQDAIVLWVGEYPLEEEKAIDTTQPTDGMAQAPATEQTPQPTVAKPRVITLVVSPQDAVTLNYLVLSKANLSLALRSAGDDSRINTESVTLQFIMQQYNIPMPSPLAFGTDPAIKELELYEAMPVYVAP